ncbi:hypothetical protein DFH94DRAFT_747429 [Russula ochroleuca]|uniref:Secreted protein n=1 Tax=Russula ochroleuca TaxID=152965 RepID=A0A9P5MUS5_9AGAM|nr:hypothetical protein DFH94DRAFT_747429 [Russula ochroleuca]
MDLFCFLTRITVFAFSLVTLFKSVCDAWDPCPCLCLLTPQQLPRVLLRGSGSTNASFLVVPPPTGQFTMRVGLCPLLFLRRLTCRLRPSLFGTVVSYPFGGLFGEFLAVIRGS